MVALRYNDRVQCDKARGEKVRKSIYYIYKSIYTRACVRTPVFFVNNFIYDMFYLYIYVRLR